MKKQDILNSLYLAIKGRHGTYQALHDLHFLEGYIAVYADPDGMPARIESLVQEYLGCPSWKLVQCEHETDGVRCSYVAQLECKIGACTPVKYYCLEHYHLHFLKQENE